MIVAGETIDEVNGEGTPLLVDGDPSTESIEPKLLTSELAPALALVAAGAMLVRGAGERERRKPALRTPRRPRRGRPLPREIDHLHGVLREDELAPEVEMHHEEACDLLFDQALAAWSERDANADARDSALRALREELPPLPDVGRTTRCAATPPPTTAPPAQRRRPECKPLRNASPYHAADGQALDDDQDHRAAVAAFATNRRSKRLAAIGVALAILFCWFGLPAIRNAGSPTSATPNTASAAATSRGELRQVSHTTGAPAKRIEDIQLGDRVAASNPHREEVELVEPDEETWREVRLRLKKDDGGLHWINLLRPAEWLEIQEAQVGGEIFLDLPEMGAVGDAEVLEVLPCPKIDYGHGAVVTGQFRHEVVGGEIVELRLDGQATATRVTSNHPYWSTDRDDFIPAGELKTGERLDTLDGDASIASVTRVPYSGLLYNLETTEHVYRVAESGTLVHNTCGVGAYSKVGGHHIHAKAAFPGTRYSIGRGLAISQNERFFTQFRGKPGGF